MVLNALEAVVIFFISFESTVLNTGQKAYYNLFSMSNHFTVLNIVEMKQLWSSRNIFSLVNGC